MATWLKRDNNIANNIAIYTQANSQANKTHFVSHTETRRLTDIDEHEC